MKIDRARARRMLVAAGTVALVLLGMLALIVLALDAGPVSRPPVGG